MEVTNETFEKVHLYVEKILPDHGDLLLDFIEKDEFLYFRSQVDNNENGNENNLNRHGYIPCQIMVHDCAVSSHIPERALITMRMEQLIDFAKLKSEKPTPESEQRSGNQSNFAVTPATVFAESYNGAAFSHVIDDSNTKISRYIPKRFITYSNPQRDLPRDLDMPMDFEFEVRVWNVGQGNANSVSDGHNTILFDAGATIHASKDMLRDILKAHKGLIGPGKRTSLIISHWDCDHYNLLTVVSDDFLNSLQYVFYPNGAVSLTSKQILGRIEAQCRRRIPVVPTARTVKGRCGISEITHGTYFTLYTGEVSTSNNRSGLLIEVHNENGTVFFTADHSNYQVWGKMYIPGRMDARVLHIVVPHHGGSSGKCNIPLTVQPGIAAISVGKNGYGHPEPAVINAYQSSHFPVIRTDDPALASHDIQIPL